MNDKIKQLISEQLSMLKIARYNIPWTELVEIGYSEAIKAARETIQDILANTNTQTTETTSAEGIRVEAHQYVFSVQELESIVEQAFNIGVEHATNAIRQAADYGYLLPNRHYR